MRLRLHTNQLSIRILGTLTGIGFLAIGAYAVFGADDTMMRYTVEHLDSARDGWTKATAMLRDDLDHADAAIAAALQETDP